MLGGSRARGDHAADSDVDLGLYYRPPLDIAGLGKLAREVADSQAKVTERGAWGAWVDGGAWLTIADTALDWLYRDLDRVHLSCQNAVQGRVDFHFQVGHPMGVLETSYAGEIALGSCWLTLPGSYWRCSGRSRRIPPHLAMSLSPGSGRPDSSWTGCRRWHRAATRCTWRVVCFASSNFARTRSMGVPDAG